MEKNAPGLVVVELADPACMSWGQPFVLSCQSVCQCVPLVLPVVCSRLSNGLHWDNSCCVAFGRSLHCSIVLAIKSTEKHPLEPAMSLSCYWKASLASCTPITVENIILPYPSISGGACVITGQTIAGCSGCRSPR